MKKNFAKKLATVLSLTMAVSLAVPVVPASAATNPDIAKRRVNVYEGLDYSYAVTNSKGYTVKWSVSGEGAEYVALSATKGTKTVLTVDTEGAVEAKSAPVVVRANFYKNGKLTKWRTDSVKIKVNATAVVLSETKTAKVGEEVNFKSTLTPANSTNTINYTVTKDAKETTDATIDAEGNFVATVAGDYKVKAEAKNASAVKAQAETTIKVVTSIVDVKLLTPKQLQITFDSSVKGVVDGKEDVKVNVKLNDTVTAMVPVFTFDSISEDGKVVKVSTYDALADKSNYIVTAVEDTFDLYAQIGTPVSISLENQTVPAATSTKVAYTLKDQYGVDVTSLFDAQVIKNTSVPFDNLKPGYLTLGDKTVAFVEYNYTIANADGTTNTITTGTKSVTGVAATIGSDFEWNIGKADFTGTTKSVKVGDNNQTIYGRIKKSDGNYTLSTEYNYVSLNESFLMIDTVNDKLTPIAAGTALVKVVDSANNTVGYINVTVLDKPATASIKASTNTVSLSNNIDNSGESKTVTITNVDQYGTETNATIDASASKTYVVNATKSTDLVAPIAISGNAITFTATPGKTGSFTYLVTTNEGKTTTISVSVVAPGVLNTYVVDADNASIDAYVANTNTVSQASFKVYGVDAAGVKRTVVKTVVSGPALSYTVTGPTGFTTETLTADANGTVVFTVGDTNKTTPAGNYTLTVSIGGIKYTKTIAVVNTRSLPVATVKALSTTATTPVVLDAISNLIGLKINDTTATISSVKFQTSNSGIVAADATIFGAGTGTVTIYVTTVTTLSGGISQDVAINQAFRITK